MSRELELSIRQERRSSLEISGSAECVRQQLELQFRRQSSGSHDVPAPIHSLDREQLGQRLGTRIPREDLACRVEPCGLSLAEVEQRLAKGRNVLTPPELEKPWMKFLRIAFSGLLNVLLWICVGAEIVLYFVYRGENLVTPAILSGVILATAAMQLYTELKAQSSMEALQELQVDEAQVVRLQNDERRELVIFAEELVPGDVIFLEAGQRVPADVRILYCSTLEVDNSALTGETLPEPRSAKPEPTQMSSTEARCLAFSGTSIMKGSATCVVYATGDSTFLGQIANTLKCSPPKSSLEIQIEHFVHIIALVALAVTCLVLLSDFLSPKIRSASDILQNCATALFSQVPEGLLPTVTLSLMIASRRMSGLQVAVKKLDAIESLGCVSTFCSDKTGTLTTGVMEVREVLLCENSEVLHIDLHNPPEASRALAKAALRNNSAATAAPSSTRAGELLGSPTEVAIFKAAAMMLKVPLEAQEKPSFEIPFHSEHKWMLTVHSDGDGYEVIIKGAPEKILALCGRLDQEIELKLLELMTKGLRVLALARRTITKAEAPPSFEGASLSDCNFPVDDFQVLGFFAIEDPPRDGVMEAVARCKEAGVKVVMVTGDHPTTARAIAKRIAILPDQQVQERPQESMEVLLGDDLDAHLPEEDFDALSASSRGFWQEAVRETRVFARVSPLHKRIIVQAYQKFGQNGLGDIVAMTGDGVNDAPALKQAEVGITMGIRGASVAQDAADIILLDDNFSSAIVGMEQGRLASENLQKSIMYTLCSKLPQVLPALLEVFGLPLALAANQVLLIDIGTDIWTAVAFANQGPEASLMSRKPRHPQRDRMVGRPILQFSYGYMGCLQCCFCWLMYFIATPKIGSLIKANEPVIEYTASEREIERRGMTVYYWTLVLGQVAAAFSATTKTQPLFGDGGYGVPNSLLNIAVGLEIFLSLFVMHVPWLTAAFEMEPLPGWSLILPFSALFGILAIDECRKRYGPKRFLFHS